MSGRLFIVGTPIGNLSDFSPRGVQTLSDCDFIAAEDTRVTLKLLNHFEIKKRMVSYREHNRKGMGETILNRILQGESCALVSDAGMPAISDPGEDLVALCHANGVEVSVVPGPSALIAALALSGMPTGRFTFEGFLSVNKRSRTQHLADLVRESKTMVFYEAPHKLRKTLQDLYRTLGDRNITLVREITKIHEEVIHTTLDAARRRYSEEAAKGELVLIVAGKEPEPPEDCTLEDGVELAREYVSDGMSLSMAAKEAAQQTGLRKSDIYGEICKTLP